MKVLSGAEREYVPGAVSMSGHEQVKQSTQALLVAPVICRESARSACVLVCFPSCLLPCSGSAWKVVHEVSLNPKWDSY